METHLKVLFSIDACHLLSNSLIESKKVFMSVVRQ